MICFTLSDSHDHLWTPVVVSDDQGWQAKLEQLRDAVDMMESIVKRDGLCVAPAEGGVRVGGMITAPDDLISAMFRLSLTLASANPV